MRYILPLFGVLLLLVTPVNLHAQDESHGDEIRQNQAWLALSTDAHGVASVSLEIPAEVADREQLKRTVAESFSFPLQFDNHRVTGRYGFEEFPDKETAEADLQRPWTTITATSPKPFSGGIIKSTCQIDLRSLLALLQQHHVDYLKVLVLFRKGTRAIEIQGVKRTPIGTVANVHHYYADIDVRAGTSFPVMKFAVGYSAVDFLKKCLPLFVFLLLPALGTFLSARRSSASPAELWGKHLRFFNRLLSVVWLAWLPIFFLSGVGEIILFVTGVDHGDLGSVGEAVNVAFYFIPPVIAMFLCHAASGRVYEQVRSVDWSPRQVVRQAIIANAISLIPMFLLILGMHTFVRSPRQTALYVIVGYVGFILLSQNMGRLLGSRLHALTSGDLRDRLFDLAHRAGVKLQQVYVLPETSAQLSNAFARS